MIITWKFGEWISSLLLQEGHHNVGVDFERQYSQKCCQRHVCHYTDEGIVAYRNQGNQHWSKYDSGMDRILPMVGFFKPHDELHGGG